MISEKEYRKAKQTIVAYEEQQRNIEIAKRKCISDFPIGCLIQSKKSKHVRGKVVGYGIRECTPLLKLEYEDGQKTICLTTNAIRL